MEILIRRLKPEDAEPLSRIEEQEFSMPWSAADFAALTSRENCLYLVAEAEGRVVGSCGMTFGFGEGNIDNVVVCREFQNRGIAQRLLEELFVLGQQAGVEAYTLEVRVTNARAIHVYEKLGFVAEGVRPRFYEKPTEDALIMWRR